MNTALALELLPYAISLGAGILGIWQHGKKKNAEKVRDSIILAVEHAASLPQMRQTERVIKGAIYARAVIDGVQPMLKPVVDRLTADTPDDTEQAKRTRVQHYLNAESVDATPTDGGGADRP